MLRTRAVPALLLAVFAAAPACSSDHRVPPMDQRAAVPRTEPMPQAPAGTIYPSPSAAAREGAAPGVTAPQPVQTTPDTAVATPAPAAVPPGPAPVQPQVTPEARDTVVQAPQEDHSGHDGHEEP